ncbi:hypothetical protein B0H11DRAFT_1965409 [Mycena galericulata]|nr:hypothetical protein B0H11DRAFT_1965409 [Mycena galericulata]
MDARLRGTFLTSAGLLFASIGFTLSVLSTLLRLLLPFHPTGANVTSPTRRPTIHRTSKVNHRRRRDVPSTNNSSISSWGSTSSSLESDSVHLKHPSTLEANVPKPRNLEPPPRSDGRPVSEFIDRPDFRRTVNHRRGRSESTPPSPSPWVISHSCAHSDSCSSAGSPRRSGSVSSHATSSVHLPRASSFESAPPLGVIPTLKSKKLSFVYSKKVRKAPSAPNVAAKDATHSPSLSVEKRKSQLLAPLLHRRRSQHTTETDATHDRRHSVTPSEEGEDKCCFEDRRPQDIVHECRPVPKRSQTLRTQPYEAPYFFPTPGSVAAEDYLPPRRKPVRSRTMPAEENPVSSMQPPPLPVKAAGMVSNEI